MRRRGEGGWGGREGGAADGSVMPGSNAIHFSIIRLRHDPRHHLSPPCRLPAPHICSAGRSTSTPESPSDRLPVFPSQLCEEAPHLPEGRCLAAPLSLARPINSFNSAPWRPTPRFALLSCPQSWVGGGGCRDRGVAKSWGKCREKSNKGVEKHLWEQIDNNKNRLRQPLHVA